MGFRPECKPEGWAKSRRWSMGVMFSWTDKEIRHADEAYIAISVVLTLAMLIGALFLF
ncbi:MAG: hypothetical protein HY894_06360 [Deltaproteobacteria bacterium]|nr:hypothetical protein [Deltaproteobacteria bacterium]